MARPLAPHPCDVRKPLHPWKGNHLYIGDDGEILCGRCMGVESTYKPWAYSDLGPMGPDRSIDLGPQLTELGPEGYLAQGSFIARCETDRYASRPETE